MISENEFDNDEIIYGDSHKENVKIIHKLVATNDWINFIYYEPQKQLLSNMKKSIKKDEIRTKSISLPKNIFFYLEILSFVLLAISSWLLFSWSVMLNGDQRFLMYGGKKNSTDFENITSMFFMQTKANFNETLDNITNPIDYNNDTTIIPEIDKYHKTNKGCKYGLASSILANFFLVFFIYMCIRVAREKYAKYKEYHKGKKVGLNICMIFLFILLTLVVFLLTIVAEIYIIISLAQETYKFIHTLVKNQLISNSLLFVSYVMIILFYFKI